MAFNFLPSVRPAIVQRIAILLGGLIWASLSVFAQDNQAQPSWESQQIAWLRSQLAAQQAQIEQLRKELQEQRALLRRAFQCRDVSQLTTRQSGTAACQCWAASHRSSHSSPGRQYEYTATNITDIVRTRARARSSVLQYWVHTDHTGRLHGLHRCFSEQECWERPGNKFWHGTFRE